MYGLKHRNPFYSAHSLPTSSSCPLLYPRIFWATYNNGRSFLQTLTMISTTAEERSAVTKNVCTFCWASLCLLSCLVLWGGGSIYSSVLGEDVQQPPNHSFSSGTHKGPKSTTPQDGEKMKRDGDKVLRVWSDYYYGSNVYWPHYVRLRGSF